MKSILARIWAFYGAILFVLTLLLFFVPFLICFLWREPKRSFISYPLFRVWMNIYLPLIGVRVIIRGANNFQRGTNYVVICNHNSFMDVPVSSPYIPGPNKTIAKNSMAKIPLFGTAYKLGSVLVDRNDPESRRNVYAQMKKVLAMGLHMCIYPEGTRNKTSEPLKPFHDGAFRLAVETQTAIIPSLLFGTKKILPPEKTFWLWPGKIEFHFLSPVPAGKDAGGLKEKCFELMIAYFRTKQAADNNRL